MRKISNPKENTKIDALKNVKSVTLGCRLNGWESDKMQQLARDADVTDAVVVNTCAVTNEAVRQARQSIRRARKENPKAKIVVTGCAVQIDPTSFANMDEVDAVLGNDEKMTANAWAALKSSSQDDATFIQHTDIMDVTKTPHPIAVPKWNETSDLHQPAKSQQRARAFVQIQNGCDHRCTFCIIPFGRGNSRSVPPHEICAEIQQLVDEGVKEVVLTGVDISSYGGDLTGHDVDATQDLGHLVRRILIDVPDLHRLRLSSIDVAEIDPVLQDLLIHEKRIAPYLHLSLQAGDNMILKRMKRRHTREQAIDFCQELRAKRPEISFGADIIAGFPTETDEMFDQSMKLIDECGLQYLHIFPFSPRIGTPAARMPQLDRPLIKSRAAKLRAKGDIALHQFLDNLVGSEVEILTEKAKQKDIEAKIGRGRLANFTEVLFDLSSFDESTQQIFQAPGQLMTGKILNRQDQHLHAVVIDF